MRAKLVKEVENVVEARLLDIFISRQLPPVEVSPIETWPPALNIGQVGSASRVEVSGYCSANIFLITNIMAELETQISVLDPI